MTRKEYDEQINFIKERTIYWKLIARRNKIEKIQKRIKYINDIK